MEKEEVGFVLSEMMRGNIEAMVDVPGEVKVLVQLVDKNLVMHITVAPDDVGHVIGKGGRNVRALRTILSAAAMKARVYCELNVMEFERVGKAVRR